MGFFPGTALPFLGRVAKQQGGQGNGGCSGLLRWEGECGGGGGRGLCGEQLLSYGSLH